MISPYWTRRGPVRSFGWQEDTFLGRRMIDAKRAEEARSAEEQFIRKQIALEADPLYSGATKYWTKPISDFARARLGPTPFGYKDEKTQRWKYFTTEEEMNAARAGGGTMPQANPDYIEQNFSQLYRNR
jgi:hypothetical protein